MLSGSNQNFNSRRSFRAFKDVLHSTLSSSRFGLTSDTSESQNTNASYNHLPPPSNASHTREVYIDNALSNSTREKPLTWLQLPASLPTLDRMSPECWSWVHSSDFQKGVRDTNGMGYGYASGMTPHNFNATLVYSPAGDLVPIPVHLMDVGENEFVMAKRDIAVVNGGMNSVKGGSALSRSMTVGRGATTKRPTTTRKPVASLFTQALTPTVENQQVKRFFIKVTDLHMKSGGLQNVICVVGADTQKCCTSVLHVTKDLTGPKGYSWSAHPSEGFLFDVPADEADFDVTIRLYSQQNETYSLRDSSSTESLSAQSQPKLSRRKSIFGVLKRASQLSLGAGGSAVSSNTSSPRSSMSGIVPASGPASPSELGSVFAEISFTLPTAHAFNKVSGTYSLMGHGNKEVAKVWIQMGLYQDYEFRPEPAFPPHMKSHGDELNVYLRTSGSGIWKKYWVKGNMEGIFFHDYMKRESTPSIGFLPFSMIQMVAKPPLEDMAAPFAIGVTVSLPWDDSHHTLPLSMDWRAAVISGGDKRSSSSRTVTLYFSADSKDAFSGWMTYLNRPPTTLNGLRGNKRNSGLSAARMA